MTSKSTIIRMVPPSYKLAYKLHEQSIGSYIYHKP